MDRPCTSPSLPPPSPIWQRTDHRKDILHVGPLILGHVQGRQSHAGHIPSDSFHCIVFTKPCTGSVIFEWGCPVATTCGSRGGVVLVRTPGIAQVDQRRFPHLPCPADNQGLRFLDHFHGPAFHGAIYKISPDTPKASVR